MAYSLRQTAPPLTLSTPNFPNEDCRILQFCIYSCSNFVLNFIFFNCIVPEMYRKYRAEGKKVVNIYILGYIKGQSLHAAVFTDALRVLSVFNFHPHYTSNRSHIPNMHVIKIKKQKGIQKVPCYKSNCQVLSASVLHVTCN